MDLRTSSLIRAGGATLATAIPSSMRHRHRRRWIVLAGSDYAARRVDPGAVQLLSFTRSGNLNVLSTGALPRDDRSEQVAEVTAALSWAALGSVTGFLGRRLHLPRPLAAVVAGAVAYGAGEALVVIAERVSPQAPGAGSPTGSAAPASP